MLTDIQVSLPHVCVSKVQLANSASGDYNECEHLLVIDDVAQLLQSPGYWVVHHLTPTVAFVTVFTVTCLFYYIFAVFYVQIKNFRLAIQATESVGIHCVLVCWASFETAFCYIGKLLSILYVYQWYFESFSTSFKNGCKTMFINTSNWKLWNDFSCSVERFICSCHLTISVKALCFLAVHPTTFLQTDLVTTISNEWLEQSRWNLPGIFNSPQWWLV